MKTEVLDFLALIENKYPHVKPSRDNEYAHIEDFKQRYLKFLSSVEIEDLALEVLNCLEKDPWTFNSFFWLVDRFSPDFRYKAEEYIKSGRVTNNLGVLKNYAKTR